MSNASPSLVLPIHPARAATAARRSPGALRTLLGVACAFFATATRQAKVIDGPATAPLPADALHISTVAAGLASPWGMAFLPDGRLLVTERAGRLRLVTARGRMGSPIKGMPRVDHRDHGGLLDVALDPGFAVNRTIYLSYTEAGTGANANRNGLSVARARLSLDATRVDELRVLFQQKPRIVFGEGLGGRVVPSRDRHLYITIGDRVLAETRMRAQSLGQYEGKTLRIRTDGTVPKDNPFARQRGALGEIWSLGHRNAEGAFVHPRSGDLWVVEHGPQGGDEINVVHKGLNYGWPVVTYGCEYGTCATIGEGSLKPGMQPPLTYWTKPSIAPSSMMMYTANLFPEWRGNLFIGALAGKAVWRVELGGTAAQPSVLRREMLFAHLGERIRNVQQGPDGGIYLMTDGARARIVRIGRQD